MRISSRMKMILIATASLTMGVTAAATSINEEVNASLTPLFSAKASTKPTRQLGTTFDIIKNRNPYYESGGCLRSTDKASKVRVCNSNDSPQAAKSGLCHQSPLLDYTEVRMASQSWETNYMLTWLLQIVLSELVEVPTTIELGFPGNELDFYDPEASFGYGRTEFYYDELLTSEKVKDCRLLLEDDDHDNNYQACYHLVPEVWYGDRFTGRNIPLPGAEPARELGALGYQSFWIPKISLEKDPSLVSYVGLKGQKNRQKLAETFKRPTTWKDYCEQVTPDNCTTANDIARRAPADEEEANAYFMEDIFTGHFRYTEKNNCTLNPTTCSGFFADFPCGWASFAIQQLYHLNIALESDNPLDEAGGFGGAQMMQLYQAANATGEPLIIYWYDLSTLFYTFIGTDYAPTRLILPEATQECLDARINNTYRCGKRDGTATLEELVGDPLGVCAATTLSLKKVVGTALKDISFDPDTPEALWSPAYHVIENFQVSTQQLGQILQSWVQNKGGPEDFGLTLRQSTCQWAIENLDFLKTFIPETHPRVIKDEDVSGNALFISALAFSTLAILLVFVSMLATFVKRNTHVMYYAQPQFIMLLLLGLGLVATGALCLALPPSDVTCVMIAWIVNLGYAIHLMPLLVRINAINNLATSGKQMKRVRLRIGNLYKATSAMVLAVGVFVLAWMVVDMPRESFQYEMTEELTEDGETIVTAFDFCGSANAWYIMSYLWIALLVLPAGMIAYISLRVKEDLNDTGSLSLVLFIHALVLVVGSTISAVAADRSDLMGYQSLVLALDVILSLCVYIFPKFIGSGEEIEEEPLPDVFVGTTIAVIEVVGFTAWSSVREPVQVFKFLEELYECMDAIAEKHFIYKVQTVGECYVAASGLPTPRLDHALCMARFARSCMKEVSKLTKKLEVKFGPDTGDLCLRMGLHSGSVTGGFMKGKGTRFQLFGDTMTTATLIQRTGLVEHIHLSEATFNELTELGKRHWLTQRNEKLMTKEKGEIQTYWLTRGPLPDADATSECFEDDKVLDFDVMDDSKQRWIQWNVETFKELLKEIVARRGDAVTNSNEFHDPNIGSKADMPLEDVVEIIELPNFDRKASRRQRENAKEIVLSPLVTSQLKLYITEVADMYNDNPFHNFAHASYVVMAVVKYMNRIKAAHEMDGSSGDFVRESTVCMAAIHRHTYGVASDPLTLFSVVFSALIHDANHPGVPNPQLIEENEDVASKYKSRSVAEQRSFDLSWKLLMEKRFNLLRSTICCNDEELKRFRQLVINAVMATDLGDKEMKELRNSRWDKAFAAGTHDGSSYDTDDASDEASFVPGFVLSRTTSAIGDSIAAEKKQKERRDGFNRKATIIIEHLIQAADVAHMSQHWAIYRKWNECLFRECYKAFKEGRAQKNPADGWYKGEIGFFDFYIIPLSKKLRDCGVFGPTSDENLNYATNNRNQWEREGQVITQQMLEEVEREYKATHGKQEQAADGEEIEWSGNLEA